MSIKKQILNKIKSINDSALLRELDAWIREAEEKKKEQMNEPSETFQTECTAKKLDEKSNPDPKLKSTIDYLEKIAEKGGVEGIENPVEWQKKERRDRTLTLS